MTTTENIRICDDVGKTSPLQREGLIFKTKKPDQFHDNLLCRCPIQRASLNGDVVKQFTKGVRTMSSNKQKWIHLALAPTGGLFGAVIGGVLWAKYIQWTNYTSGAVSIVIGILVGLGVILTSRSPRTSVGLIAALFAVFGILVGKYLDVKWNAPKDRIVGIIQKHEDIPPEYAENIAKMYEASESEGSTWKLMKIRMQKVDLLFAFAAATFAFYVARSRFLHQFFFRIAPSHLATRKGKKGTD